MQQWKQFLQSPFLLLYMVNGLNVFLIGRLGIDSNNVFTRPPHLTHRTYSSSTQPCHSTPLASDATQPNHSDPTQSKNVICEHKGGTHTIPTNIYDLAGYKNVTHEQCVLQLAANSLHYIAGYKNVTREQSWNTDTTLFILNGVKNLLKADK